MSPSPLLAQGWNRPAVWVIEDVHSLDSASWSMLLGVYEARRNRILMLMTSRPVSAHERCSNEHMRLKNLKNPCASACGWGLACPYRDRR